MFTKNFASKTLAITTAIAAITALNITSANAVTTMSFPLGYSKIYVTNDTFNSGVAELEYEVDFNHKRVISGDWDGDGKDSLAYQDTAQIYFMQDIESEIDYHALTIDTSSDIVSGDFNADGIDDIATRKGNQFTVKMELKNKNEVPMELAYGRVGDDLFVGDWDGDGLSTFAVRRGNHFYIKNDVSGGIADKVISYGRPGDEVLVGDWDGDGVDTFAVRRGNHFHIKDTVTSGVADRVIAYGRAGDQVVVGDWDGDGKDSLVVRRPVNNQVPTNTTPPSSGVTYQSDPKAYCTYNIPESLKNSYTNPWAKMGLNYNDYRWELVQFAESHPECAQ